MAGPLSQSLLLRTGFLAVAAWLLWVGAVRLEWLVGPWKSVAALVACVLPVLWAWLLIREHERRLVRALDGSLKDKRGDLEDSLSEIDHRDPLSRVGRTVSALIWALKENSLQLTAERETFTAAVEGIGDGLIIAGEDGDIQFLSPKARRFWGVADDWQKQGLRVESLFRTRDTIYDSWRSAVEQGGYAQEEHESGNGLDALLVVHVPFQTESRPIRWITVLLDISEVAVTLHTRREFIGNLSHELRNSLAKLKANAEVAMAAHGKEDRNKYMERMLLAVSELSALQQGLMDLYLLETGLEPIQTAEVDLPDFLQTVFDSLSTVVKSKGLAFQLNEVAQTRVLIDGPKIAQVLTNLIQNAIKHTPAQGEITLSAAVQRLPLQDLSFRGGLPRVLSQEERKLLRSDPVVIVRVRDTGVGIPGPLIPSAFERLRQLDQNTVQEGMGLGLSLARFTMRAHKGLIWAVNNQPGPGITFSISLPQADWVNN